MPKCKTKWLEDVPGIACNLANYANLEERDVEYICIHYTGNARDTAKANCEYFQNPNRGASAHFFVDEDRVLQSVPLCCRAWAVGATTYKHTDCRNQNSVSVEMCCSGNYTVSEKTKEKTIDLTVKLFKMFGWTAADTEKRLLRHYDVTGKLCPAQMAGENNAEWKRFKESVKEKMTGVANDMGEVIYNTINDVPSWAKPTIEYWIKGGVFADPNKLNLTYRDLRLCVLFERRLTL